MQIKKILAVGLAMFLVLSNVYAPAQSSPAAAQTGINLSNRALLKTKDAAMQRKLAQAGAKMLEDYGAFSLWDVSGAGDAFAQKDPRLELRPDYNVLNLNQASLNTLSPASIANDAVPGLLRQTQTGSRFGIVQFYGPVKDAWLDDVRKTGAQIVTYMAENAFVVYADDAALSAIAQMAAARRPVQWAGAYHPFYRITPLLQDVAALADKTLTPVTVQIYRAPLADATTARLIALSKAAGGAVLKEPSDVLVYRNISLELPASALIDVANWQDVFAMREWVAPQKMDESQGQILAGNVISSNGKVAPASPGYLAFLSANGFPTNPSSYPIVDVVDDGVDIGDPANVIHPDFRQFGQTSNPSRIVFSNNCTPDASADGRAGHGNLNAGIVGGYNNGSTFPAADENGYRLGLGISPYSRLGNTKIFANSGSYNVSLCGNSDAGVVLKSFTSGAKITSNSWGSNAAGAYDDSAQAYDALTRDANNTPADGNQQMLHVFSAGNKGANGSQTVGSPGTAKNVMTVGATENVRANGVMDGCNEANADNADDIAGFSSRGPTADQRTKPDIMAPGTHVQGPASQAAGFDGTGVCAVSGSNYYPPGQTLYTWSSGTSHSAPAVSGAASLLWEYYGRVIKPGTTPSPAMLKALMLNAPRYLQGLNSGGALPSNTQGWGDVNLGALFDGAPRQVFDQSNVFSASGEVFETSGKRGLNDKPLRVTLVWTDAPGPLTGNSYINNLDLEVTIGGQTYKGNVFNGAFSAPGGVADARNNVESVFVPASAQGEFSVRVIATNIAGDGVPGNADLTDQDFALVIYNVESAIIAGDVRDSANGQPIPNARVVATQTITRTVETRTNDAGAYRMFVAPGTYDLRAAAYGYAEKSIAGVSATLAVTQVVPFALNALPMRMVSGYVTSGGTGLPLLASITASGELFDPPAPAVSTNPATGYYSISLASGQAYTLRVESLLHTAASRAIGVLGGDMQQNFALTATTTNGGARGVVRNSLTGEPIAGATVRATDVMTAAVTDSQGRYQLMGLPPGQNTLAASAALFVTLTRTVSVPQSNFAQVDFDLPAARVAYNPSALDQTLQYGAGITQSVALTLTNTGTAPLVWQATKAVSRQAGAQMEAARGAGKILTLSSTDTSNPAISLSAVTNTLNQAGYVFDVLAADLFPSLPLTYALAYESVVFVGNTGRNNPPMNAALMAYLDAGGRLLITDNDLGFWNKGFSFYDTYLQAKYIGDDACVNPDNCLLRGADLLAGVTASVAADPYPDRYNVGEFAQPLFTYVDGIPAGSRIERGNYRAVYYPFDFEYLSGEREKRKALSYGLEWLAGRMDVVPWVNVFPTSGVVQPGQTQTLAARWEAGFTTVSGPGAFNATLRLNTNAPAAPVVNVPLTLTVTSSANQAMLFGAVLAVSNCGATTQPLAMAQINVTAANGDTVAIVTGADGQFGRIVPAGVYTLTVLAQNFDTETRVITLAPGQTLDASIELDTLSACMEFSPQRISAFAEISATAQVNLYITSTGGLPLSVAVREISSTSSASPMSVGLDAGGYTFVRSNEAFGSPYLWLEPVGGVGLYLTDDGAADVPMPFPFVFYSQTVSSLRVGNNGGIIMSSTAASGLGFSNVAMANAPNYLVAPFWDDLDASTGEVLVNEMGIAPNRKMVVTWAGRTRYGATGNTSFQVVFHEGGSIAFHYLETDFENAAYNGGASATAGIRGPDAAHSLEVSFNAALLGTRTSVCFTPPGAHPCGGLDVAWLSVEPAVTVELTGVLPITVTLNPSMTLSPGTYHAQLMALSNSPLTPQFIPVEFTVKGQNKIWLPLMMK